MKSSRNIEGLLTDKLTGGGTDRGTHGYNIGNRNFYRTKDQEGKNFLKATDRYYNKDNWGRGASPFMQGPSSPGKDRILGMLPDSEALDDFATDKASEEGGSPNWDNLPSIQHDSYKTNYSNPDELGPDSEALEESAIDEASQKQMLADEGRIKKGAIDERFMKEFARKGEKHNAGLLDQYKKGLLDLKEQFTSPEEITGIQEITNPAFREAGFAQEKRDRFQDSMPEQEEQSMLSKFGDSVSNFFGDDDEEKAKNYKAMASAYKGANTPSPQQGGNTRMQNARTVAGKVAFPGLLNKPKRQKTPYFMPKGLV